MVSVLGIKRTMDALASVGAPISVKAILNGLSSDYDPFVVFVLSLRDSYTVVEVETLLLVQEERLERHNQVDPLTLSAPLLHTHPDILQIHLKKNTTIFMVLVVPVARAKATILVVVLM